MGVQCNAGLHDCLSEDFVDSDSDDEKAPNTDHKTDIPAADDLGLVDDNHKQQESAPSDATKTNFTDTGRYSCTDWFCANCKDKSYTKQVSCSGRRYCDTCASNLTPKSHFRSRHHKVAGARYEPNHEAAHTNGPWQGWVFSDYKSQCRRRLTSTRLLKR